MAENFSQLPPNSTGEKIRLFENTVGPNDVNSEAVTITDASGNVMADLDGSGRIKVNAAEVAVPVTDNGGSLTVDGTVTATLPANSGVDIGDVTINNASGASAVNIQDGGNSITVDGTVTANAGTGPWPVTDNGGSLTVDGSVGFTSDFTKVEDVAHTTGDTGAFVLGVRNDTAAVRTSADGDYSIIATDSAGRVGISDLGGSVTVDGTVTANAGTGPWPVTDNGGSLTVDGSVTANPTRPATSTLSAVATSTTSATLIASNANRLGVTIYNDSNQNLFVKFGTTASTTDFTIRLASQSYYEVPFGYTGRIDGVQSTGTGTARVTELTA